MAVMEVEERNRLIGENVRKYRLLKGQTQDELAEGICSVSQLSKMENGKTYIKREVLREIAIRLGVTIEQLETADAMLDEIRETYQMAMELVNSDSHEAGLEMAREVVEKSRAYGYPEMQLEGMMMVAFQLIVVHHDYKQGIAYIEELRQEELPLSGQMLVRLLIYLGDCHWGIGNQLEACRYYCQAEEVFHHEDPLYERYRSMSMFALARIHYQMGNLQQGLRYACGIEQFAKGLNRFVLLFRVMIIKANILSDLGEEEQATEIFETVLRETQYGSRLLELGSANAYYGMLLQKQGQFPKAIQHLEKAIKLCDVNKDHFLKCKALLALGEVYFQSDQTPKAAGRVQEALGLAKRILENTNEEQARGHRILGRIAKGRGDIVAYISHLESAMECCGDGQIGDLRYEIAVELAETLYERGDKHATEVYRRAIRYAEQARTAAAQIR